MMLHGYNEGGLELRQEQGGAVRIAGRFPYNTRGVLSRGGRRGRPRKEVIKSRAFAFRVDDPEAEIHFLAGHSYDKPLASRSAGTLDVRDGDDALTFSALIAPELQEVGYVRDFLGGFAAGLVLGLSPGFAIPPEETVPDAVTVEEEDPAEGRAIIRNVNQALLYELSAVTVPVYKEAQIEARSWDLDAQICAPSPTLKRWLL